MKKAITISDDEEMENEITLLMGGQVELTGPRPVQVMKADGTWEEQTPTMTESPTSRDLTVSVDTNPASRTYGQASPATCIIGGEAIFQTQKALQAGEPPLCPDHLGESHRVVSTPQADGSWTHQLSTITPTQKAP